MTGEHFIDALTRETGAVDDAGKRFAPHENRNTRTESLNGPVVIRRLPAGHWACDACTTRGHGWEQIEAHYIRTKHDTYTETRKP